MGLAIVYRYVGRYSEAEKLLRHALDIRERHPGKDLPKLADNLDHLAILYMEQLELDRAEPLYQRVFEIREQTLGADHPDVASGLNNLGLVQWMRGEYEEAEALMSKADDILEKALGSRHIMRAWMLDNQAGVHCDQGEHDLAEPLYLEALSISEESSPAAYPFASLLSDIAKLYRERGELSRSESFLLRALEYRESILEPDHADLADNYLDLAWVYLKEGRNDEAARFLDRAEAATRSIAAKMPNDQVRMAAIHLAWGDWHRAAGEPGKAEERWQRALDTIRPLAEGSEVVAIRDLEVKAGLRLGRVEEARPVARRLWQKGWRDVAFVEICTRSGVL